MILLELEDFDYAVEFAYALDNLEIDELKFCPMFVFLIDWAYKRKLLDEELTECEVFKKNYPQLLTKSISFSEFVLNVLDSKLMDSNFSHKTRKFISDYIEYDGYTEDLQNIFNIHNMWFLPEDFEKSTELYNKIDESYSNYLINKKNYPELVIFYSPEQLKKERDIFGEENI